MGFVHSHLRERKLRPNRYQNAMNFSLISHVFIQFLAQLCTSLQLQNTFFYRVFRQLGHLVGAIEVVLILLG
jgi:hypothetical protein